jgi:uncharacterized paraquat-inducible protein A
MADDFDKPKDATAGNAIAILLLSMVTLVTVLILAVALGTYIHFAYVEPTEVTFPGDPNIGLGFVIVASILNLPAVLAWTILGVHWLKRRNANSETIL